MKFLLRYNRFWQCAFWLAIIQHALWGLSLIFSHEEIHTTAMDEIYKIPLPVTGIGFLLILIAIGVAAHIFKPHIRWLILFTWLQQIVLLLSAYGASKSIYYSQFADGVIRSRWFLIDDQSHHILLFVAHFIAIAIRAEEHEF